jgi:ribonuclease HII
MALDRDVMDKHGAPIVGVDEVGVGPLAGPLCACALSIDVAKADGIGLDGLEVDDSKKLTRAQRQALFNRIVAVSTHGLGWVSVPEIQTLGIGDAGHLGRKRAVEALIAKGITPKAIISDWYNIDVQNGKGRIVCIHLSKADQHSFLVACASIVAKVHRDCFMIEQHALHPEYNWISNVGYGTEMHIAAIARYGMTALHRRSMVETALKPKKGWAGMGRT